MKDKIILTDVDGVLVNWKLRFNMWMEDKGYQTIPGGEEKWDIADRFYLKDGESSYDLVCQFNETAYIRSLTPERDAIRYVKKLHEDHGFSFHAITAMNPNSDTVALRQRNLRTLFGKGVFLDITFTGEDKKKVLSKYKNSKCYWIEDYYVNADLGKSLGLSPILLAQEYNNVEREYPRLPSWKAIYNHVVEGTGNDY